ncbi:hypothetical protein HID58_074262, partial [Brassica napus]
LSLFTSKPKDSRLDFPLPPSPPSRPVIGHLHLLLSVLIHKSFQKLSSKYGPFLYLRIFNVFIVLVSSSSIAYEIFKKHDMIVSFRGLLPRHESLLFGSSTFLMAPYGDYWKFMKKLIVSNLLGSQALERLVARRKMVRRREPGVLFDEFLEKILRKHEEEKISEHQSRDMMDVLLEASRDENADYKITRNHIKYFLIIRQTTQWTMAEIMNDTNILERLKEEIDCVVGKQHLLLMAMLMRDPDSWEEPLEFKPERFLASSILSEQVLKYIPFGSGLRGCPGANLANILIGTAIGTMVQWFDWRIKGDKVNLEEAAGGMNLTMAHPLKCNPVARNINFLASN